MTKQSVTQCRLLTQHAWGSAFHPSAPKQERKQKQTGISKRKTWVKHSSSLSLFSSVRVMASMSKERAWSWEVCSLAQAGRKESIALWVPHPLSPARHFLVSSTELSEKLALPQRSHFKLICYLVADDFEVFLVQWASKEDFTGP